MREDSWKEEGRRREGGGKGREGKGREGIERPEELTVFDVYKKVHYFLYFLCFVQIPGHGATLRRWVWEEHEKELGRARREE